MQPHLLALILYFCNCYIFLCYNDDTVNLTVFLFKISILNINIFQLTFDINFFVCNTTTKSIPLLSFNIKVSYKQNLRLEQSIEYSKPMMSLYALSWSKLSSTISHFRQCLRFSKFSSTKCFWILLLEKVFRITNV